MYSLFYLRLSIMHQRQALGLLGMRTVRRFKLPRQPVYSCCCLLQCTRVSFSTSSGNSLIGKKSDWTGSDHCNSHRDLTCDCIWSSASIRASGGRMRLYIPPRCDEGFFFFFTARTGAARWLNAEAKLCNNPP